MVVCEDFGYERMVLTHMKCKTIVDTSLTSGVRHDRKRCSSSAHGEGRPDGVGWRLNNQFEERTSTSRSDFCSTYA